MDTRTMEAGTWARVSPFLDQALDLDPADREEWLAQLTLTQPVLAPLVRSLLAESVRLDAQGFLDHSPFLMAPSLAGSIAGAYTLERPLGRGGMGEVWLARRNDGRFEGSCAVKFLDESLAQPKLVERFRREGVLLARLAHPNIARLLDAGTANGRTYLALEYVDGERIDAYCARLTVGDRVRLFVGVVGAVAHAHSQLIVHRDLKPSNVLVTRDGQVKLLDFGIAKLLHADPGDDDLTRIEDAVLTPEYAAPEQMLGELPTTATDVYQLGMLLYVLLTGRHPLATGGTRAEKVRAALAGVVPRASEMADADTQRLVRGDLDAILDKSLRRDPKERYATAQELKDELLRYVGNQPVAARRGAAAYRVGKFIGRHRLAVVASSLGLASLCAALVFAFLQTRETRVQRDVARRELNRATASNEFATFLLSAAAPGGGKFSAAELIGESERLVRKQFAHDNPMRAELLTTIGTQYMLSEHWPESRAAFESAAAIADGAGSPALIARARCPLALLIMLNAQRKTAETMMDAALAQIPAAAEYAAVRGECLTRASEFGFFTGESAPMIRNAKQAVGLLESTPGASALRRIDAHADLAYGYYLAKRNREADAEFARTAKAIVDAGRERTLATADLYNNWALVHFLGDIRKAAPLQARAVELRRSIEGDAGIAPTFTYNYAGLLLQLGRLDEALPLFEQTIVNATAREEVRIMFDASMEIGDLYIEQGEFKKARDQLASVAAFLNSPRFDDIRKAQLEYYRAHLAERQGDLSGAQAGYAQAVKFFEGFEQKYAIGVRALCGLSRTELALGNRPAAAEAARRALALAASFAQPGEPSYLLGMAQLVDGDRLRAAGTAEEAVRSLKLAHDNFEQTLGVAHPLTREAANKLSQRL
ncbi:MAG: serine/threonine-protein kinase [Pseudomonadota bacterium]